MSPFPLDAFLASLPWTALAVLMVLGVTFAVAVAQRRHSVMDVAWGPGFVAVALMIWTLAGKTGKPATEKAMSGRPGVPYVESTSGFFP